MFLEVLDDPYKKELFIYLMCYIQIVRREGNSLVELSRYLSCSSSSFKKDRHHWKDLLVELNIFYVVDTYNRVYIGKDIYKVDESDINLIGLIDNYAKNFEDFSYRVTKYWNIINRAYIHSTKVDVYNSVSLLCLIFNEELYEEAILYAENCGYRFMRDGAFFEAIKYLSLMESSSDKEEKIRHAKNALKMLGPLKDTYYEVNIRKLIQDVNDAIRKIQKNRDYSKIKIEMINLKGRRKGGILQKVLKWIEGKLNNLKGGKKWTLDSSEIAFCSSIDYSWKNQKKPKIQT